MFSKIFKKRESVPKEKGEPVSEKKVEKKTEKTDKCKRNNTVNYFDPVKIWPNKNIAARFWCYTCGFLLIVLVAYVFADKFKIANRQSVAILAPNGDIQVARLMNYKDAGPLHDFCARYAADALLSRNPNGFDDPEGLKQIYTNYMYKEIIKQSAQARKLFKEKDIHQKCEITDSHDYKRSSGYVLARVVGQLIRTGHYKGQTFTDSYDFTLDVKLQRNYDWQSNFIYPYNASWVNLEMTRKEA